MILKRFSLVFIVLFSVFACNKLKGPKKPDNLISKDKMVAILIDAKLIASASSKSKLVMRDRGLNTETYIYDKFNIDSLQFALSNNYYAFHIEDYQDIYKRIEDSLEVLKAELKETKSAEWKAKTKREADSLQSIHVKKDSLNLTRQANDGLLKPKKVILKDKEAEVERLIKPVSDGDFQ